MKRALVTGSLGFIGRHLVPALEADGWDVDGIDIRMNGDVRDYFRHESWASERRRYDAVIHLAAVVGGRETIEANPLALAVNLEIDAALFSWAVRTQPKRVVYFSSSAAYPVRFQSTLCPIRLHENLIRSDAPGEPDALYGWVKLTGERLAGLARQTGTPVTILRPFSGYGGDQDPCYPFPALIGRAQHREDPFVVWGPGGQVRDWIHVDDIVAATIACIDDEVDGPLNLGWGRPVSFFDLARLVTSAAGYSPTITGRPEMPTGVVWRVADPARMLEVYRPRVCLEEGVSRALAQIRV